MAYASTTLKNFLNEDLGTLKQIADMPKEWKQKLIQNYRAGENSEVTTMDASETPAKLTKFLKDESRVATILKVDGKTKYYIEKISPQKFKVMDADEEGSIRIPRRKAAEAAREAQWKKEAEERQARIDAANAPKPTSESISNPPKVTDVLNERRGGRGQWHDPAELGEYNAGGLLDFIKKLTDKGQKVELVNIYKDVPREKKSGERSKIRNTIDPLEPTQGSYNRGVSAAAKKRFEKFEEKKRAEIDKKVDIEIEKLKDQILINFDDAMEKVLAEMRKGYGSIDAKSIGEKILAGVNLDGIKRFKAAYELIDQYRDIKPAEILSQLKKLGFGPKKRANESATVNEGMWDPQYEDMVSDWLHDIHDALQDVFGYSERESQYLLIAGQDLLEKYWKLRKTGHEAAGILAKDPAFNKEAKSRIAADDVAQDNYDEMVAKNTTLKDMQPAEQAGPPSYNKMDKFEMQKEIDKALDAGDYETLEKLKNYIPESLKESITELLKEVKMETNESTLMHQNVALLDSTDEETEEEKDMNEGVSPELINWLENVYIALIQEFEMDEDEADDFMGIVQAELHAAFEDGLLPEEAAALVYTNEEALEQLARIDPAYQSDFGENPEETGTQQANRQDPGQEIEY